MGWIRGFSIQEGQPLPTRTVKDAPSTMRQELIDHFFCLAEMCPDFLRDVRLHRVICQSLGMRAAGNPYAGYRHAAGRDIERVPWPRVYDLIIRLWPEFDQSGLGQMYRDGVNRILAAHGVAWDLGEDGRLHRVLPVEAAAQVSAAFGELQGSQYAAALALFNAARDAFDDRPRPDRDACSNIFDAMESVAKEKYGLPNASLNQIPVAMPSIARYANGIGGCRGSWKIRQPR